jgi:hypothetical protein
VFADLITVVHHCHIMIMVWCGAFFKKNNVKDLIMGKIALVRRDSLSTIRNIVLLRTFPVLYVVLILVRFTGAWARLVSRHSSLARQCVLYLLIAIANCNRQPK